MKVLFPLDNLSPNFNCIQVEKCCFEKKQFEDKLMALIELSGCALEGCNSKTI